MQRYTLTPGEVEELRRLYEAHAMYTAQAAAALVSQGADTFEFTKADRLSTETWGRIRDTLEISRLHGMKAEGRAGAACQ